MANESTAIIYSMIGVGKTHEKKQVLKGIYLSFYYGAKIGVLGANGSGKSTLLRIMAGIDTQYDGKITKANNYTIGLLEQEPKLDEERTVIEIVRQGLQPIYDLLAEYDRVNEKFAEPMGDDEMDRLLARQGELQEKLDHFKAWEIDSQLEMAMDALRCPPGEMQIKVLSGGEKRRVALCRLLLQQPDILLLDEPTNHLDAESVAWLERHLHHYEGTIIAVTHDRYFLDNVAGWILELDRGEGIPWKGNYTSWLGQKKARLQIEEKVESQRQKMLARELEWVSRSPSGRMAKNKARIAAYEKMVEQNQQEKAAEIEIYIPPGPRLGTVVVEAKNLTKGFGDRLLLDGVSFALPPGGIVGIVGPNGAGKTTLFRMITGSEKPDSGELRVGETVKLAYVEQTRGMEPNKSVWEVISGGEEFMMLGGNGNPGSGVRVNSRAFVARFGFTGGDQQKKVGVLSGGERNRVHLATMLKSGANVLLLDEPTNDLDVNTIRAVEEALENFAGCAVIISHDRWFLDRVATHILAFEGDSQVRFFNGNWTAYDEDRHKRLGTDADQPHRLKYRKLTRV